MRGQSIIMPIRKLDRRFRKDLTSLSLQVKDLKSV